MAKDGCFCDLCGDKIVQAKVIIKGIQLDACTHCKKLCVEDESLDD